MSRLLLTAEALISYMPMYILAYIGLHKVHIVIYIGFVELNMRIHPNFLRAAIMQFLGLLMSLLFVFSA
jgi:hypothetical protein